MRKMMLALAMVAIAVPAPAIAQQGNASKSQAAPAAKERKYCLKEESTGSRLSGLTCKTKSEWARDGIDIVKLARN